MSLYYKIDVIKELKAHGFSTYRLLHEKNDNKLSSSTLQKLKKRQPISWDNLDRICNMLECQPDLIIGWKPDATDADTGVVNE